MLKTDVRYQYTGNIMINDIVVKSMSQTFLGNGRRDGSTSEYLSNPTTYYQNLQECREDEDEFLRKMREVEDKLIMEYEEGNNNDEETNDGSLSK